MNKDNAKEYLPLVQALADGKVIEHKDGNKWYKMENFSFSSSAEYYRIKKEPKYVPFTFEDRELFRGKYIRSIDPEKYTKDYEMLICSFNKAGVVTMNNGLLDYRIAFERYEFVDGTPFGKLQQQL